MSLKHIAFGFRFFSIIMLLILLVGPLSVTPVHATGECYVWEDATNGNKDGASWADAYTDLQSAFSDPSCTEIWVAAGIYKPTVGTDRAISFTLKNGVAIYGGFAGDESSLDDRDWSAHVTILSGDIGTLSDAADNSFHVVKDSGADSSAVLDGFVITAGNANGTSPDSNGGGMVLFSSSPTLTNVTFSANTALGGGGMSLNNSSPSLTNVTFSGNTANNGGGMYLYTSSPTLTNVTYSDNHASFFGGGMFLDNSTAGLTNVTFSGNTASESGGGMVLSSSSPTLTNVTFSGNHASILGGGMILSASSPTLTNVTFSGNTASSYGGGMVLFTSSPKLRNSILWGNTAPDNPSSAQIYGSGATISDSIIQDGCPTGSTCTAIILTNPNLGTLGNYGGFTQTIPLLPGSSAIDAGDGVTCPLTDQRGNSHVGGCDIGAFESQGFTFSSPTGTNQSAPINTAFTTPLGLSVTANAVGEPVNGGVVTFTSSVSDAWRTNPATFTAIITGGVVSATATANDIAGGPYQVTAIAAGVASGVNFNLTNTAAPTTTSTTTTTLTSSENFDIFGDSWTLTATVTTESGTPSGSVTFKDDLQTLGTVTLSDGVAIFNTGRLPGGAYTFTAEFDGSDDYIASVSNALDLKANFYTILPLVFR